MLIEKKMQFVKIFVEKNNIWKLIHTVKYRSMNYNTISIEKYKSKLQFQVMEPVIWLSPF